MVEDLGRVRLRIGQRLLDGTGVRRRVLGLLSFLVTRSAFSATRDEVLDALWPDLTPGVAGNSLNQTVYFLRRVIDPEFVEDTSADYVHFESNVLWLDRELVQSTSAECWALISSEDELNPEDVSRLSRLYVDRFALDFAYEEWAIPFRDALHAGYLQVIETAVRSDIDNGQFRRGAALARAALAIDSQADTLEALLVRLYRISGAHAAAAEQYGHYATALREGLGVEAPPLNTL
jgi:DNA-binding SARP family transcriptional activator